MENNRFKHFAEVDVTLRIKNNRDYSQTVNVMGNPYDLLDISNATTEYKWDLTGFSFTTETYVQIEYKDVNQASFSLFTQNLVAQNLNAVITALNLLGIGFFYQFTTGGSTFITTSNDQYVFGNLSIEPTSGTTTTTTTTTTTAAPTTTTTTTTSTTTAAPTTTTTTTTTTAAPTTTTTTTTTTEAPTTTTTTTSTTTAAPTTTTTTTTTTEAPTTTTTTTTTTAAPTTTTTTTTTTLPVFTYCLGYDAASGPASCADYITFCT